MLLLQFNLVKSTAAQPILSGTDRGRTPLEIIVAARAPAATAVARLRMRSDAPGRPLFLHGVGKQDPAGAKLGFLESTPPWPYAPASGSRSGRPPLLAISDTAWHSIERVYGRQLTPDVRDEVEQATTT
jgi:hypothetical protein